MARKNLHRFQSPEGEPRHAAIDFAIGYLAEHYAERPSLEKLAKAAGFSLFHFHRTFTEWTGITPKQFIQYLQLGKAKDLLIKERSLMATAYDIGLSGPSRLHDLFVSCDAVSPGEFKKRGAGIQISYGVHESPYGSTFIGTTDRGICFLGFPGKRGLNFAITELRHDWPGATVVHDPEKTAPLAKLAFARGDRKSRPKSKLLPVHVRWTNFQIKVWQALLEIPFGRLATYQDIAAAIGMPDAARAVGQAVGANPVSLIIPCHRVILKSGIIHNYRWGAERKRTVLAIEQARNDAGQEYAGRHSSYS